MSARGVSQLEDRINLNPKFPSVVATGKVFLNKVCHSSPAISDGQNTGCAFTHQQTVLCTKPQMCQCGKLHSERPLRNVLIAYVFRSQWSHHTQISQAGWFKVKSHLQGKPLFVIREMHIYLTNNAKNAPFPLLTRCFQRGIWARAVTQFEDSLTSLCESQCLDHVGWLPGSEILV